MQLLDGLQDLSECQGSQPYLFEPYESDASEGSGGSRASIIDSDGSEEVPERLQNTNWYVNTAFMFANGRPGKVGTTEK